jgi:hypothetical protein
MVAFRMSKDLCGLLTKIRIIVLRPLCNLRIKVHDLVKYVVVRKLVCSSSD